MVQTPALWLEINVGQMFLGSNEYTEEEFFTMERPHQFDRNGAGYFDGQALVRVGDWMFEIEGVAHDGPADHDQEDVGGSFGGLAYYISTMDNYDIGVFAGAAGGSNNTEGDGMMYSRFGLGIARSGLSLTGGGLQRIAGEDSSGVFENMLYLQVGYDIPVTKQLTVGLDGYIGQGELLSSNAVFDDGAFHEMTVSVGYDLSDRVRTVASYSAYSMTQDSRPWDLSGSNASIGLSIALGGPTARDSIPFDAPHLHREMTWADEVYSSSEVSPF